MQNEFFKHLESIIPPNTSMVNELTDVLELSMDSAYRRLRGETKLTFDEIVKLCNHYRISFDSFLKDNGNVSFRYSVLQDGFTSFKDYLKSLHKDLLMIKQSSERQIVYACEDIPIFHNFNFPEIAAFKMFYWMKSIMNVPELDGKKFSLNSVDQELMDYGKEIFLVYSRIPSTEIWTDTTIESTLKQISFYWESGMFAGTNDAIAVCYALKREVEHVQRIAEAGYKDVGINSEKTGSYSLYISDLEITNNTVLVSLANLKLVYLGHLTFNTMATSNRIYAEETERWLNNLIKKSTLISGVSEKIRYQFFTQAITYIDELISRIGDSDSK